LCVARQETGQISLFRPVELIKIAGALLASDRYSKAIEIPGERRGFRRGA
jgi:hypothetical protein